MNESSLMLAIFHLKRDSTRRTHFPLLPWPQDDGVDSLIFTPIISPPINANSLSGFSQPCLLLWLTLVLLGAHGASTPQESGKQNCWDSNEGKTYQ